MEVFMGTIQMFGFQFPPRGWAYCNGQLIAISQNSALFSLLGTTYGGNGTTTFQLPNLQSRLPICQGTGPGLTTRVLGEVSGLESVVPTIANLPVHTHTATAAVTAATTVNLANVATGPLSTPSATNNYLGASGPGPGTATIYSTAQGDTPVPLQGVSTTASGTVTVDPSGGGGQPLPVMNPFLTLNFSIALEGIFPSRN